MPSGTSGVGSLSGAAGVGLEARLPRYRGCAVAKPRLGRGGGLRGYVFYAEAARGGEIFLRRFLHRVKRER